MGSSSILKRWNNPYLAGMYEAHKPAHVVYQGDRMWIWSDEAEDMLWFQLEPGDMKTPFNCEHEPMSLLVQSQIQFHDFVLPYAGPQITVRQYLKGVAGRVPYPLDIPPEVLMWFLKTFTKERFYAKAH